MLLAGWCHGWSGDLPQNNFSALTSQPLFVFCSLKWQQSPLHCSPENNRVCALMRGTLWDLGMENTICHIRIQCLGTGGSGENGSFRLIFGLSNVRGLFQPLILYKCTVWVPCKQKAPCCCFPAGWSRADGSLWGDLCRLCCLCLH